MLAVILHIPELRMVKYQTDACFIAELEALGLLEPKHQGTEQRVQEEDLIATFKEGSFFESTHFNQESSHIE